MVVETVWIRKKVFDWSNHVQSGSEAYKDMAFRSYEMWKHVENKLANKPSSLERVDIITALKRCAEHRIKTIEKAYNLNKLSFLKDIRKLERLEHFGLIRPLMLKNLINVRNTVEHDDADPPDINRCRELLDFIWYFLKSTDHVILRRTDELGLQMYDGVSYGLDVEFKNFDNHEIYIRGNLPQEYFSKIENNESFSLKADENFKFGKRYPERISSRECLASDIWISGISECDVAKDMLIKLAMISY